MLQFPQRYRLVWLAMHTLYWLHTLSGQNRIQLATACKGEEAERGDEPLYCYTLTRKNLEVKHHRETDSTHD